MSRRKNPIVIDGVEYPSQRAAARALGISDQAVWFRVHPEYKRSLWQRDQHRRRTDPKPEARRTARISAEDAQLAARLIPFNFPGVADLDQLVSYALRRLAETTDD